MRVRLLVDVQLRSGSMAAGSELSVYPDVGNRMIAEGRAAEVLDNGKLRRRRGRPKKPKTQKSKTKKPATAAIGYKRSDLRPEA